MGELLALDLMAYALDDLGVRQRRHVANISEVAGRSKDPAHDLARAGLGHIRDDPDMPRSGDWPDLPLNRLAYLLLNLRTRLDARLQGHVHLDDPPAQLVYQRNRSGLGNLFDRQTRRLNPPRSQSVPLHIDHIIDPHTDPEKP